MVGTEEPVEGDSEGEGSLHEKAAQEKLESLIRHIRHMFGSFPRREPVVSDDDPLIWDPIEFKHSSRFQ